MIRRPRLGLPTPGPRGLPPTPRRCHRLRTGRMSPLFPPPPAAPGRLPREAPRGQRASFPAAPPSRGPGPGAWQAGSTLTIGAKPGNWSKGREGPDQATVGRGAPWGARASGCEGAVPELAGAVGFSRVSDGRCDPRQPALCLLDHSLLVLSSSGTWAHPAGGVCPAFSSPGQAALHLLTQAPSRAQMTQFPVLAVLGGPRL